MIKNHIGKLMLFSLLLVLFASCETTNPNFQEEAKNADFYHRSMKN